MKPAWPINRDKLCHQQFNPHIFGWQEDVRIWIMYEREVQGRGTVTYRLEIPQCNYLPIVELEEEVVFRPELKEEL